MIDQLMMIAIGDGSGWSWRFIDNHNWWLVIRIDDDHCGLIMIMIDDNDDCFWPWLIDWLIIMSDDWLVPKICIVIPMDSRAL